MAYGLWQCLMVCLISVPKEIYISAGGRTWWASGAHTREERKSSRVVLDGYLSLLLASVRVFNDWSHRFDQSHSTLHILS